MTRIKEVLMLLLAAAAPALAFAEDAASPVDKGSAMTAIITLVVFFGGIAVFAIYMWKKSKQPTK